LLASVHCAISSASGAARLFRGARVVSRNTVQRTARVEAASYDPRISELRSEKAWRDAIEIGAAAAGANALALKLRRAARSFSYRIAGHPKCSDDEALAEMQRLIDRKNARSVAHAAELVVRSHGAAGAGGTELSAKKRLAGKYREKFGSQ
jgi:hypothetical protein